MASIWIAIGIGLAIASYGVIRKAYPSIKADNPFEQAAEQAINHLFGRQIDLSPEVEESENKK